MEKNIYCVYDRVAHIYGDPILDSNDQVATRGFLSACEKSPFCNDLQLYCLGTVDNETGEIVNNIRFVCDFVKGGAHNE